MKIRKNKNKNKTKPMTDQEGKDSFNIKTKIKTKKL